MLRGSPVPGPLIRKLRTYTREYRILVQQRTKVLTQMDRTPVMCGIRLSSCIGNIDSGSFMQAVEALIRGKTDPEALVQLVYGNRKNKESGKLRESLTGNMKAHHCLKLTALYLNEMQKLCEEHFSEEVSRLTTLPGVSQVSAMIIAAEMGGDMSAFENSGKFTGWTGLRPGNGESAGKFKSTATTKGNRHLRTIIVQTAWAASRTKGSFFMDKFTKLAIRKSRKKALVAIGREMPVIIRHILA